MGFGKAFHTRKEASAYLKRKEAVEGLRGLAIRKMSKKVFPRRKKLFHVGTASDFINFVRRNNHARA